jgi:molybdopterin synthase catalytic subunit
VPPSVCELSEEIGTAGDQAAGDNLVYLGLTRELTRGGTPEIFFLTRTSRTETEIRASWRDARDRWEASRLEMFHFGACAFGALTSDDRRHAFMSTVDAFLDRHLADASIPLLTAIALWADQRLHSTAMTNSRVASMPAIDPA